MKVVVFDDFNIGLSERKVTPEGFLQAPAVLARTGVQLYRARELSPHLDDLPPDKLVRLWRPPEEVFAPDSMASFNRQTVVVGHPGPAENGKPQVNVDNWKDLAVGDVHGIKQAGKLLACDQLIIRDKDAIEAIDSGKKFLSNGYTFDLDLTPGRSPDGEDYDGIQRNIRGNHVAIVSVARGGSACRIADSAEQGAKQMKKITVGDVSLEVEDSVATVIETLLQERDAARNKQASITLKIGDREKTVVGDAAILAELQAKDTTIAELQAKVPTQAQLDALVASRSTLVGDACKLVPDFKAEGKTDEQVQREVLAAVTAKDEGLKTVVDAVLEGKTSTDAEPAKVATAFKVAVASHKEASAGDDGLALALAGKTAVSDTVVKPAGRDLFLARTQNSWKK